MVTDYGYSAWLLLIVIIAYVVIIAGGYSMVIDHGFFAMVVGHVCC